MLTYLFNKLPAVRRLRSDLAVAQSETAVLQNKLSHAHSQLAGERCDRANCEEELADVRKKRNELFRQTDEQRAIVVTQAATITAMKTVQHHHEQLLNEHRLTIADARERDTRWSNTVDTLNSLLRSRSAEGDDLRQELADAQATLARHNRPVLFARTGGLEDAELDQILAGKGGERVVKALLQVLDECAVQAMSEAASAPVAAGEGLRGFTAEDRTFSSGGVFALTSLKRVLEDKLTAVTPEQKEAA